MKDKISREEAEVIVKKYLHEDFLLKHSRETEVIMRALARHFGEDEDLWGLTGFLHDLDMEETREKIEMHSVRTCEILREEGYEISEMFHAIQAHTENLGHVGVKRESRLDYALSAAENITGLIVAYAIMRPGKLDGASVKSLTKKLNDKSFAANVSRECINDIEKTGLERREFLEIALDAMKGIASEIGL